MKKSEAAEIVHMLMKAYPASKADDGTSRIYETMLVDLDANRAMAAIKRLLSTCKFLPTIAEIREAAAAQTAGPRKTGNEAYEELNRAVLKHGHTPVVKVTDDGKVLTQKPWPPIAPDIAVAMRRTWGTWADCCSATRDQSVSDRARFIEAYDGMSERDRADLVSGVPLPAPQAAAPRLAAAKTNPPEPVPPKTLPRGQAVPGIAVPKQNTPAPVPIVAPRQPPGPTPFQGRRLSAEEIEAELKKRSAK